MDDILLRLSVESVLAQLEPLDRDIVVLCAALDAPTDYTGPWPPTLAAIGAYIGVRTGGRPLSEGAVRSRRRKLYQHLATLFGGIE
jgi:hypothetical protein